MILGGDRMKAGIAIDQTLSAGQTRFFPFLGAGERKSLAKLHWTFRLYYATKIVADMRRNHVGNFKCHYTSQ